MVQRPNLQSVLEAICPNVYFQPPENLQMEYPAIVYNRDSSDTKFADNKPYSRHIRYDVALISQDPDDPRSDELAALPMSLHQRFYVADNLNHDVFTIYH